ncbi:MAG: OmpA family protein [Zhengella sp.]|uniref:OmpA family protein n=1 Tax=Zhengella sp. TaxID=2282762 RepID=UPI00352845F1
MRAQARRAAREEEEESAFVSMTDMTVGFLFIIMIMLAFFASQTLQTNDMVSRAAYEKVLSERNTLSEKLIAARLRIQELEEKLDEIQKTLSERDTEIKKLKVEIERLKRQLEQLKKVDPLESYLAQVAATRRKILVDLRNAIRSDFPDLQLELSEESDALRFQGEGLFASGQSVLTDQKEGIVSRLAQRLDEILPCYTIGERSEFDETCNPGFVMIEAVQIEGHTDNTGSDRTNRELSTARANNTFYAMTGASPQIMQLHNLKGQPVLSVAAYGPDRPVATNSTPVGRATNRRIDLRFIMVTPQDQKGIETIRRALQGLSAEAE